MNMNYTTLLFTIPGLLNLFMAFMFLILARKANQAQRVICALQLCVGWLQILDATFFTPEIKQPMATDVMFGALVFAIPILYYLIVYALTRGHLTFKVVYTAFLPILIYILFMVCIILNLSVEEIDDYTTNILHHIPSQIEGSHIYRAHVYCSYMVYPIIMLFILVGTAVMGELSLRRYRKLLDEFYATHENQNLKFNHFCTITEVTILLSVVGMAMTDYDVKMGFWHYFTLVMYFLTVVSLTLLAFRTRFTAAEMEMLSTKYGGPAELPLMPVKAPVHHSDSSQEDSFSNLTQQLNKAVEDKYFLDANITLPQLSESLGVSPTHLSRYLHIEKGVSFAEFTNSLRIAYALELKKSNKHLEMKDLATMVGYRSLPTFLKYYSEYCGNPD